MEKEPSPQPKSRWLRNLILLAVLSALAAWGAKFVQHMLSHEETEDAYIAGTIHTISSQLPGTVAHILVAENTDVTAGQPLVELDTRDLDLNCEKANIAVQQAEATVAQAEAKLAEIFAQNKLAKSGETLAIANVARDEVHVAKAKRDLARAEGLKSAAHGGAISEADYENARSSMETATATLGATKASLEAAISYIDTAKAKETFARAEIDAAKAHLKVAQSSLKEAELQRSYATIQAPVSGRVSRKAVEVGNRIQPGQAMFALVEKEVWIQANFKETQMARLKKGVAVDIIVDAIPGRHLPGHIDSFSAASGAQFALLPPDNATGNFTKIVQRVPVKIVFDPGSIEAFRDQIRPGLSAWVSIDIGSSH